MYTCARDPVRHTHLENTRMIVQNSAVKIYSTKYSKMKEKVLTPGQKI